jgi:hypothetical protein
MKSGIGTHQIIISLSELTFIFRPYSREKAVWPVSGLKRNKFWPSVSRVDDGV